MNVMQLAIARSARQMADRVAAGTVTTRADKLAAVWLFDQVARYAAKLTHTEFLASAAAFEPIFAIAERIESWHIYTE